MEPTEYFTIYSNEDGEVTINQYNKQDLIKHLEENYWGAILNSSITFQMVIHGGGETCSLSSKVHSLFHELLNHLDMPSTNMPRPGNLVRVCNERFYARIYSTPDSVFGSPFEGEFQSEFKGFESADNFIVTGGLAIIIGLVSVRNQRYGLDHHFDMACIMCKDKGNNFRFGWVLADNLVKA